jgi:hypothetical protein
VVQDPVRGAGLFRMSNGLLPAKLRRRA